MGAEPPLMDQSAIRSMKIHSQATRKMPKPKMLLYEQAEWLYDRVGAKQDTQRFYERPALADLVGNLELARAERLIEFGCGTGRFAEELLDQCLPTNAGYVGLDLSSTMTELARNRTAFRWLLK
jgi:predicted TPR repeat methyltransferase